MKSELKFLSCTLESCPYGTLIYHHICSIYPVSLLQGFKHPLHWCAVKHLWVSVHSTWTFSCLILLGWLLFGFQMGNMKKLVSRSSTFPCSMLPFQQKVTLFLIFICADSCLMPCQCFSVHILRREFHGWRNSVLPKWFLSGKSAPCLSTIFIFEITAE